MLKQFFFFRRLSAFSKIGELEVVGGLESLLLLFFSHDKRLIFAKVRCYNEFIIRVRWVDPFGNRHRLEMR